MTDCTVVIPCYNEAARLPVDAFRQFADGGHPVRFLLVNDGSRDDTQSILEGLRDWDARRFEVLQLPRNMGKAEAVRRGMLRALTAPGETAGFWDADLATPLESILEFHETLRQHPHLQMVLGTRIRLLGRRIQRRFVRGCLGRTFAMVASTVLRLPVYDTQCGAKMFRVSSQTRSLFEQPFCTNWIFDVELLARMIRLHKAAQLPRPEECVYELPLPRWCEVGGSKVRSRDFLTAFFELARIYWTYLRPGAAGPRTRQIGPSEAPPAPFPPTPTIAVPPDKRRRRSFPLRRRKFRLSIRR